MKKYKHLFGPLMSRRFGRSLGIDLCPIKTCSYDCIFCQLGSTDVKTTNRREFFPLAEICKEISSWLEADGEAAYITLAGSGEPTLYSRFGELIDFIHSRTDIPALLLSNGSLFNNPTVREAAAKADVVKISMSAWNQKSFEQINRPAPGISFEDMVNGEIEFTKHYKGKLILEVFLLEGINANEADIKKIVHFTNQIKPDIIHLNTVTRPAAEDFAHTVSKDKLEQFATMFTPTAQIPEEVPQTLIRGQQADKEEILALIRRRPVTLEQLATTFEAHPNEIAKITGQLMRDKKIIITNENGKNYFKIPIKK